MVAVEYAAGPHRPALPLVSPDWLQSFPWRRVWALSRFPWVTTSHGPVLGRIDSVDGVDVGVFQGVPYALPPLDQLRFRVPQLSPCFDVVSTEDLPAPTNPRGIWEPGGRPEG